MPKEITTDTTAFRNRKRIYDSFIELAKAKNVETISVKQVTDNAGISRGTFYLHFADMNDLITSLEDYLLGEMPLLEDYVDMTQVKTKPTPPTLEECTDTAWEAAWFTFFDIHKEPLNALLGPHGDANFYNKLKKKLIHVLNSRMILDGFPHDDLTNYFQSFHADTFIILAREWTQKKYDDSLNLKALCAIASTLRIGCQYSAAIGIQPHGEIK